MSKDRGAWSIFGTVSPTRSSQGWATRSCFVVSSKQTVADAFTCLVRRHGLMVVGLPSSRTI